MEIPDINMISNFEAGVNCLQNPSMISKFFNFSGVKNVPQFYSFWKWGALFLAIVATFSSLIRRIKLFLIRFRIVKPSAEPLLQFFSDDLDFSDVDDDGDEDVDDGCSSVSSEDDEEVEPTTSFRDDEDFRVAGGDYSRWQNGGSLRLRRRQNSWQRFSWSDFAAGKSVVKLWDSIGLSFDYEDPEESSVVSTWDLNRDQKIGEFFGCYGESAAVARLTAPSRAVVVSAKLDGDANGIVLGAYDPRMEGRKPAISARWGAPKAVTGIDGGDGDEKVYVRDDVTGILTVGDLRKLQAPLEATTESDGETWWDADAVIVDAER